MVVAVFVGGIFLGFSLGFAAMAAVVARGPRGQSEEAQEVDVHLSRRRSPINKFSRALRNPEVFLTPWL
jgi:hypothetical protein